MIAKEIAQQWKRITRGVYGLLSTVIITSALILGLLHLQQKESERRDKSANDYHLVISKKGLEILGEIEKTRLWFRDLDIEHSSIIATADNQSSLSHMLIDRLKYDHIDALKYKIDKIIEEIFAIQAQYADPDFNTISTSLEETYIKIKGDIDKLKSENDYSYQAIDVIVWPLITVIDQLQRLHHHAYQQLRESINIYQKGRHNQIIGLIVLLAVTGLFGVVIMLGYVRRALTDLKEAQDITHKSEHYNRTLFDQSSIGLALCRMDGELVDINPAYARIIGRTVEEALALSYWDITPETYAASEQCQLENLNKTGCYGPYEKEYIHKDGHLVPVRLQGSFIEKGGETFILSSIEDITEHKKAEAEIAKHRENLEEMVQERTSELRNTQYELMMKERLAILGQLTATVSHELRNPLGVIRLSLYAIDKIIDKNDEPAQQAMNQVDRNLDRCDNIVDELLDFTRSATAERHPVRIDDWLDSVIDEQEFPENILVEKNLCMKNAEFSIDADRMRRAVINVVENACHAMLEDNQLNKAKKGSRLIITTGDNEERIEMTITDTGSGIPDDLLEKIFEPLFSTKSFGVGLGMPSVKKIMEQHKGGIEIETDVGLGTRITLWLPKDVAGIDSKEIAV